MSLRIIYGKSGTGKSEYIFNEIAGKIKKQRTQSEKIQNENIQEESTRNNNIDNIRSNRKIYIITPEQFSFTAEKKLLNSLDTDSVISAEVLTFNRMAYRVIKEVGTLKSNLSSTGKSMLVYDVLSEEKNNLKFIGKSKENVELICTQITEFKKHGITVENLEKCN